MRRTGVLLASALLAAAAAGCSSSRSDSARGPAAAGGTPAPSPSPGTGTAATGPTANPDPVAACATKIDSWITSTFLLGKDDLGDYQEMGLSGPEGMALRTLEQQLGKTIKTFPANPPADLHLSEVQACQAAGAGSPTTLWQ